MDLDAIETRLNALEPGHPLPPMAFALMVADARALLAEVKRLSGAVPAGPGAAPRTCGSCSGPLVRREQWICPACNLIAQEG
jgi:hypothetical protein